MEVSAQERAQISQQNPGFRREELLNDEDLQKEIQVWMMETSLLALRLQDFAAVCEIYSVEEPYI